MGTLAGSTIMLLTIPWIGGLILGRCDIENGHTKDKTLTRKFDLTRTGVETDNDVRKQAGIMMLTAVSYIIIQGIAFAYLHSDPDVQRVHEKFFALAAFIAAAGFFAGFSIYMVTNTKLQQKRIDEVRKQRLMQHVVDHFVSAFKQKEPKGTGDEAPLIESSSNTQAVDVKKIGLKWKLKAQEKREQREQEEAKEDDDEEEADEGPKQPKWKIGLKAGAIMFVGTAIVALFSDPMVDTISNFSTIIKLKNPFYVSFIVTPITSNASELIAALIFAAKKKKKNISLTYGALYGAATMNNTMCLSIFLAMVFFRGLVWEFSAEVLSILFVTAVVGTIGATRNVIPLYFIFVVGLLYPLSLGLVAFLESPLINWQ
jgi:hypothetical protein